MTLHDCMTELEHAEYAARATWVCPTCGRDVSIEYVMLYKALYDPPPPDAPRSR